MIFCFLRLGMVFERSQHFFANIRKLLEKSHFRKKIITWKLWNKHPSKLNFQVTIPAALGSTLFVARVRKKKRGGLFALLRKGLSRNRKSLPTRSNFQRASFKYCRTSYVCTRVFTQRLAVLSLFPSPHSRLKSVCYFTYSPPPSPSRPGEIISSPDK